MARWNEHFTFWKVVRLTAIGAPLAALYWGLFPKSADGASCGSALLPEATTQACDAMRGGMGTVALLLLALGVVAAIACLRNPQERRVFEDQAQLLVEEADRIRKERRRD